MVKKEKYKGKEIYSCESCGLFYENREIAQKCEDFCTTKHMCNPEITKYAINK
jgi:hypothetical protein